MKFLNSALLFSVLALPGFLDAQDYFQQEVNYKIEVTLQDSNHTLSGYEEFEYINKSGSALDRICVHLWPNAYRDNRTALGRQLYSHGDNSLEYATYDKTGFIDSLDFKVNGEDAFWYYDSNNVDIAVILLSSVLQPGQKVKITTPFFVKIPDGSISRLGHVDESYQITQWYPKPAVFDKNGWNTMPYLTQGEFYSEFGSFDVSITLPKNYVVGATGDLQTESERIFLDTLAAQTAEKFRNGKMAAKALTSWGETLFPESDREWKTIRYTQSNVHDFAWFADKRFYVLKGEVELPASKRKVTTWAMFVEHHAFIWENALEYINDGVFYYSKWNGDYPYNHVTAVDGTISAGGGMEYPNITVIGNTGSALDLEVVIVHEVGHNWFYGLLGSNERDHAWMDEGLNTLNEIRYVETKYPKNERMSDMFQGIAERVHLAGLNHRDLNDFSHTFSASYGVDQPIELTSADYSQLNYGAIVYSKTGLAFTYLRDYFGDVEFDRIMHVYFETWKFKHPQPEDLRSVFEKESGQDLSWFFGDFINSTAQIDYKICSVKISDSTYVTVRNSGKIDGPIRVDMMNGALVASKWTSAGTKKAVLSFPGIAYSHVIIDYDRRIPEVNRNNNGWKNRGLFGKCERTKFEFLGGDNERDKSEVWWTPILGGNAYDKFMLGVLFHNQTIPKNKLEYTLAPMFSFGRRNISGYADVSYSWTPAKNVKYVSLGILGKTFGNGLGAQPDSATRPLGTYYVITPYLRMQIGKPAAKKYYRQQLEFRGAYVFESASFYNNTTYGANGVYDFKYAKSAISISTSVRADFYNSTYTPGPGISLHNEVITASAELNVGVTYWKKRRKKIEARVYYGQNLLYTGIPISRFAFNISGQNGYQDVLYSNYMLARDNLSGFWTNQRIENQGNFKSTSALFSSKNLIAVNLIFHLPIPIVPLVAFVDYAMFDQLGTRQSAFDIGLGLRLKKYFGIYFPLYETANMHPAGTGYGTRIRFTLTMEGLNPANIVHKVL